MTDIAPELLEKIRQSFQKNIEKNKNAATLLKQIEAEAATYAQAGDYAYEIGTALADAFAENLSSDVLPDGRMYQNIAEKVIAPMLGDDHTIVSKAAAQVQQSLNEAVGIGLKAQIPDIDTDRVQGIVRKVANAPTFDDVAWALDEPVKTFSQAVADDTLKKNAEFQSKSGLRPRIIRRAESKCCEWCSRLEVVYDYPNNVPDDIYRRHERCRCLVEYDASTGKRQNVWSKRYEAAADQHYQKGDVAKDRRKSALEARKSLADNIADHPGRLKSADPDALRAKLRGQKIRTFDLKDGGYSADLGDGKKLIYDGKGGYSITSNGRNLWTGAMNSGNLETRKQIGLLSSSGRRYEPDINIGNSVGAKAKDVIVDLPNGDQTKLTPGSRITKVETIAGFGRTRQIDEVDILTEKFPSSTAERWKKKKGIGYVDYQGERYKANLHWYEEPSVGRVKYKVKPDADGNWFYEDD